MTNDFFKKKKINRIHKILEIKKMIFYNLFQNQTKNFIRIKFVSGWELDF